MKFGCLFLLTLIISMPALAEKIDWLEKYLRSKSYKCSMNEEELKAQITVQLDQNIHNLSEALKARGSAFEAIQQQREAVSIGIFPHTAVYDFYILEKVIVTIKGYSFPIQTTYFVDDQSSVEKGLWIPLTIVKDPGIGKTCQLGRISLRDGQQQRLPEVDLVLGDPPRVVASRLIEVVDIGQHEVQPPPKEEEAHPSQEERSPERRRERRKEREERREERRRERRERRERRRHRQAFASGGSQRPTEAPPKPSACTGEVSPWMKLKCAVTGYK